MKSRKSNTGTNRASSKFLHILKAVITVFTIAIIVIILGLVGVNLYVRKSAEDYIIDEGEAAAFSDVDCILVLGASVRNGDTPSPMLADRLDKGIELYNIKSSKKLVMSGDHGGEYYDEVNVMKRYAMDRSVPSEDIFMDHAGFSTYESMYRVKEVFGADKVIIVTQRYHLYRAVYIARQLGIDAYGVPSEAKIYSGQSLRDIREYLAIAKDYVKCIVKPEPTLLGNSIDLKGSGDVTNDGY